MTPLLCAMTVSAWAQAPGSPACQQAMSALQAEEASVLSSREAGASGAPSATDSAVASARLQPWRERAARACLGSAGNAYTPPARTAQDPVTVPPVSLGPPVKLPPAPTTPAAPVVPARSDALTTIVGCDASGCWASDGSRLSRNGSTLTGPRGACTLQGAVVRCP
ncbi:hypothetical protein [Ideonella sp. YS5]|uniref:hypothetical protein n=1 Tax=Ideonella sp. YS5 TaxID=3453714 RepID=UPI003EF050E3